MLLIGCGSAARRIADKISTNHRIITVDEEGAKVIMSRDMIMRESEAYPYLPSSLDIYVKDRILVFGYLGGLYGHAGIKLLGKIANNKKVESFGYFVLPFPNEGYRFMKAVKFVETIPRYYKAYTLIDSRIFLEKYSHIPFTKIPEIHAKNINKLLNILNSEKAREINGRFYFGFGYAEGIEARNVSFNQAINAHWFKRCRNTLVLFRGDVEKDEAEYIMRGFGEKYSIIVEKIPTRGCEVIAVSWE